MEMEFAPTGKASLGCCASQCGAKEKTRNPSHLLWFRLHSAAPGKVQPLVELDRGLQWFGIFTNKCAVVKHTWPQELLSSVGLTTDCMHIYDFTPEQPRRDSLYHLGLCKMQRLSRLMTHFSKCIPDSHMPVFMRGCAGYM